MFLPSDGEAGYILASEGNGCMDTDTLDESEDGRTQRNACPPNSSTLSPLSLPLVAQTVFGAAAAAAAAAVISPRCIFLISAAAVLAVPCQVFPDGAGG